MQVGGFVGEVSPLTIISQLSIVLACCSRVLVFFLEFLEFSVGRIRIWFFFSCRVKVKDVIHSLFLGGD